MWIKTSSIIRQVELLVSVLPTIIREDCFAIKGGTAINFLWQELPRLAVDTGLVYLLLKGISLKKGEPE